MAANATLAPVATRDAIPVRINRDLRDRAKVEAARERVTLEEWLNQAIAAAIEESRRRAEASDG